MNKDKMKSLLESHISQCERNKEQHLKYIFDNFPKRNKVLGYQKGFCLHKYPDWTQEKKYRRDCMRTRIQGYKNNLSQIQMYKEMISILNKGQ